MWGAANHQNNSLVSDFCTMLLLSELKTAISLWSVRLQRDDLDVTVIVICCYLLYPFSPKNFACEPIWLKKCFWPDALLGFSFSPDAHWFKLRSNLIIEGLLVI